jgi:oxygen-independent coproporphyrinogen-3 oxidase
MFSLTPSNALNFGLYIHWPFCLSKCPYCDFNSHVREKIDEKRWEKALLKEMEGLGEKTQGRLLKTVFFGGGTPSLMRPGTVETILSSLSRYWQIDKGLEVTLEANPNSIEASKFKDFRSSGINRVSIGIQSLQDQSLRFLGRSHGRKEALEALKIAQTFFDRFSFDLIYARPDQSLVEWEKELREGLSYAGDHLSLYQLTIEPGTAFHKLYLRGELTLPEGDMAADFYEKTQEIMENKGLPSYEVSNHAAKGQECQHNLLYWRYEDYGALGPGAHGRLNLNGLRRSFKNIKAPELWLEAVEAKGQGVDEEVFLSQEEQFVEMMMMGLRLKEGIQKERIKHLMAKEIDELIPLSVLETLQEEGFIDFSGAMIKATKKGLQCLNAVLAELLKEIS